MALQNHQKISINSAKKKKFRHGTIKTKAKTKAATCFEFQPYKT